MLKAATSPYARKIHTLDQYTQWQQTYETTVMWRWMHHPSIQDRIVKKKSLSEQSCLCPQQHLRHLRSSCSAIGESINNSTRNNNLREEISLFVILEVLLMHWTSPGPTKDSASLHLVYLCKAKDKHHQDQAGPFSLWRTRNPSSSHWQKSFTNVSGSYKKNKVCRHLYQTFVSFWPGGVRFASRYKLMPI